MTSAAALPRSYSAVTNFYAGDGFVALGNIPQISFQGANPFTFEAWIYLDALIDEMNLIAREGEFTFATRGPRFYAARTNQIMPLLSDPILDTHTWYHVALSFDGVTMALYLNGLRRAFVTLQDEGVANQNKPLTIGSGFYGWLDSARLWNIAVGPGRLYTHQWVDYAAGEPGLIGQIDFSQWPPVDTSGSGATTITPSAHGVRLLRLTPAAELTSGSFCDPYNDGAVNPGGSDAPFSVMAWVAPSQLGTSTIFSNGELAGPGMSLSLNETGNVVFRVGAAAPVISTGAVQTSSWTNIACTWVDSTGAATIYIDGQLDTTGTMAFATPLANGAPLLGAAASSAASLPVNSFIGFIQSTSVWGYALSQADVERYMTDDPLIDPECVADWDLMPPRAQNNVSLNPLGLVGGAAVNEIPTTASSPATEGEVRPDRPLAPTPTPVAPPNVSANDFSEEARATMVDEFREFMAKVLKLTPAEQDDFAARLAANLDVVAGELAGGNATVPYYLTTEGDGVFSRIRLHIDGESAVIYEGELDPCTTWAISFLITVALALYTVFGFAVNLGKVSAQLTNYLGQRINTIGLVPQLRAVFANGPSPTAVYQGLRLLWDYGLLTGITKLLWQLGTLSVSIWTIISLGGRLLLLFGPFAPLEIALFITELGLALAAVYNSWNDPNNCWKNSVVIPAAPAR